MWPHVAASEDQYRWLLFLYQKSAIFGIACHTSSISPSKVSNRIPASFSFPLAIKPPLAIKSYAHALCLDRSSLQLPACYPPDPARRPRFDWLGVLLKMLLAYFSTR
jgi:hypothetical protein